jgi:hypothetical protein
MLRRILLTLGGTAALGVAAVSAGGSVAGGPAPNVVEGSVRTTDGRPVPGATIRISGATGAGRGTTKEATTDANGRYRLRVPLGHYDVDGFADLEYEGQTYRGLWLDRTEDGCGRVMSDKGIVRHFVLRVSGPKRCTTNDENAYHGGEIAAAAIGLPDEAVVTFSLTPLGPLADGTQGEPRSYTRTGAAMRRVAAASLDETTYLYDVPLGRWQVTATVQLPDGSTRAAHLTTPDGGAGEQVEVGFAAKQMYPYGVATASLGVSVSEEMATEPTPEPGPAPGGASATEPEAEPAAPAGGLPTGRYACSYRSPYAGDIPTSKGVTILAGGRYQGYGGSGTYAFDAGTQEVRWLGGPFAAPGVTATFGEVRGRPAITVVGGGAAEDPDGTNHCVL